LAPGKKPYFPKTDTHFQNAGKKWFLQVDQSLKGPLDLSLEKILFLLDGENYIVL
jgi:hypothetical protein